MASGYGSHYHKGSTTLPGFRSLVSCFCRVSALLNA